MKRIKVVIIEDQPEIAHDVINSLATFKDIEICAHYLSAEVALKNLKQDDSDIYLVDLGLPGVNGVAFISRASQLTTKSNFIIHTISENSKDLINAISAGAAGYILKGIGKDELYESLKTVVNGGGLISPRMARKLFHIFKDSSNNQILTKTEVDILNRLKTGASYENIAETKNVSLSTVQTHIKHIYKKLNVNNKSDAMITGALYGLLNSE